MIPSTCNWSVRSEKFINWRIECSLPLCYFRQVVGEGAGQYDPKMQRVVKTDDLQLFPG